METVANANDLPSGPLADLRVLDQSGPLGNYCGKLFADLGADVILVEWSAPTRRHGSRPELRTSDCRPRPPS